MQHIYALSHDYDQDEDLAPPEHDVFAGELETAEPDGASAPAIGELLAAGHGFTTRRFSRVSELPTTCRYCDGPLTLPESDPIKWVCEFELDRWDGCTCSPCIIHKNKMDRNRGGQPKICNTSECRKRQKADQQRRYRRRKKQLENGSSVVVEYQYTRGWGLSRTCPSDS